jgi:hypothetical protein
LIFFPIFPVFPYLRAPRNPRFISQMASFRGRSKKLGKTESTGTLSNVETHA